MAYTIQDRIAEYDLMKIAGQLVEKQVGSDDYFIMKVRATDDGGLVVIIDPGAKYIFAPLDVQLVRAQLRRDSGLYTADEIMAGQFPPEHAETGETTAPPVNPPLQVSPSPAPAPSRPKRARAVPAKSPGRKRKDQPA